MKFRKNTAGGKWQLMGALVCAASLWAGIAQAGTETQKQIRGVYFYATGEVYVTVANAGPSNAECYLGLLVVPTSNATTANRIISAALAAKATGDLVNIEWSNNSGACTLTSLSVSD